MTARVWAAVSRGMAACHARQEDRGRMLSRAGVFALSALALSAVSGCQHDQGPSYAESLASRPDPTTPDARRAECDWIRSEISRQENLRQMAGSMGMAPIMVLASQTAAQNNVAALESRAADVQCNAAFSKAPEPAQSPIPPARQTFNQCFASCQQLTDRTKDQCFDSCNK